VVSLVETAGLAVLRRIDPERAHALALTALRTGLVPLAGVVTSARLATAVAGLVLPNPVGLAAGFDKNAVAIARLTRAGFGFIEVGAATPFAQEGNPRPRLHRLPADAAAINRFGFNNDGAVAIAARLALRARGPVPVGLNLGANKDSANRAADYADVLATCGGHVDFASINVSSPNTERLRDLQGPAALAALIAGVLAVRDTLPRAVPVVLKISPDLDDEALAALAEVALASGIDAIIATNTTLARDGLMGGAAFEAGGLSGAPLRERATRVLARLSQLTEGRLPLIGVGGIGSAADAYDRIRAGASAVQLYTALTYQGIGLAARIARGLDAALARDGFATVADAVGTRRGDWL